MACHLTVIFILVSRRSQSSLPLRGYLKYDENILQHHREGSRWGIALQRTAIYLSESSEQVIGMWGILCQRYQTWRWDILVCKNHPHFQSIYTFHSDSTVHQEWACLSRKSRHVCEGEEKLPIRHWPDTYNSSSFALEIVWLDVGKEL